MKLLLTALFILLAAFGGVNRIAEINSYTKKAQQAMAAGNYPAAVKYYEFLLNELQVTDDKARLNLAHAYYKTNQKDKAYKTYSLLVKKEDKQLQSVSALQLGILAANFKDYDDALKFYKQALIIDPANEQARYNYELLKKYLQENPQDEQDQIPPPNPEKQDQQQNEKDKNQPKKQPDDQGSEQEETDSQEENKDQQNDPQQKQNQQGKQPNAPGLNQGNNQKGRNQPKPEGDRKVEQKQGEEPGDEEGLGSEETEKLPDNKNSQGGRRISDPGQNSQTRYDRLKKMNISPEKANMILDAMRKSEQQYIQQLPRKANGKKDKSKPDW